MCLLDSVGEVSFLDWNGRLYWLNLLKSATDTSGGDKHLWMVVFDY